jgi:hypothetical protein
MQKVSGKEQLVSARLIRFRQLEKNMFVMLFLVCIHTGQAAGKVCLSTVGT